MTRPGLRDQLSTPVAEQFEHFPFPGLEHGSREGFGLLRAIKGWTERPGSRVLDVGCGTGHTTVALAQRLPQTEFVGIDLSARALAEAQSLRLNMGVPNVVFLRADARDLPDDLGEFDVITSLGVLHHIPDIDVAISAVLNHLGSRGHIVLWLYGQHGRAQHRLNQRFLSLLGREGESTGERLRLARALLEESDGQYVSGSGVYTPVGTGPEGVAFLLDHPAWIVDQLLPAFELNFTLEEIFQLLERHGLEFERWFGLPANVSECVSDPMLKERIETLPARRQLQTVECLRRPSYYLISATETVQNGREPP